MQPITITLSYADAVTIMQMLDMTGDCPDAVEALKAALDEECPACVEDRATPCCGQQSVALARWRAAMPR